MIVLMKHLCILRERNLPATSLLAKFKSSPVVYALRLLMSNFSTGEGSSACFSPQLVEMLLEQKKKPPVVKGLLTRKVIRLSTITGTVWVIRSSMTSLGNNDYANIFSLGLLMRINIPCVLPASSYTLPSALQTALLAVRTTRSRYSS